MPAIEAGAEARRDLTGVRIELLARRDRAAGRNAPDGRRDLTDLFRTLAQS